MVCVVDAGTPRPEAVNSAIAPPVSAGAETADRAQLAMRWPMVG